MTKCKNHSPEFKAKVALAVICEYMILAELSKKYGAPPPQIGPWKRAAIKSMATAFKRKGAAPEQVKCGRRRRSIPRLASMLWNGIFVPGRDHGWAPPQGTGLTVVKQHGRRLLRGGFLAKHGKPQIFQTDQGSPFTSGVWIEVRADAKVKISGDGKGAWRDNRMIERLWRSLKDACVYLNAFEGCRNVGWERQMADL